jgi:hypothetical protein
MEAIRRAVTPALQMEIPTTLVLASTPNPSVGKCLWADLDTAVEADASSLGPKTTRVLSEAMVATWEVYRLREILPTASRVPSYSEKHVTQIRSSHVCLIIEIMA